jgi:hypothetical protein
MRAYVLIEQWGGLAAFGPAATDRVEAELNRLKMCMTFHRPHMTVSARALRQVAGELRRAGELRSDRAPLLLDLMGYPVPCPPLAMPTARPAFIARPGLDRSDWGRADDKWLDGVEGDLRPLALGDDTIVAELTVFHARATWRSYEVQRLRAPSLVPERPEGIDSLYHELPRASWRGRVRATDAELAETIVRRFSPSYLPGVPEAQFVICPNWLARLHWTPHAQQSLVYVDRGGDPVASLVWWRDGVPVDVHEDGTWGEGVYLRLTSAGRAQIEAILGHPLRIVVTARRTVRATERGGEPPRVRALQAAE